MRIQAQKKGGFYAAAPVAVAHTMQFVEPPRRGKRFAILDPCCGEGEALAQIAELLGCRADDIYGIELEADRAEAAKAILPDSPILGPASFFGAGITPESFGFAWVNPPFDADLEAGERVEVDFLKRATKRLAPDGVMALVVPEATSERHDLQQFLLHWFDQISVCPFPAAWRPYSEVVVFGVKRREEAGYWPYRQWGEICVGDPAEAGIRYRIPETPGPVRFEKTELTDRELAAAYATSPLRRLLESPEPMPLPSPPLPLGKGHIALLLASGHLDGIVCPPSESPHVVRGTAKKIRYVSGVEQKPEKDGTTSTITIYSEKITLTVRVATAEGTIHTFDQDPNLKETGDEENEQSVQADAECSSEGILVTTADE